MGTYETFDHTADLGLRVRAGSLDDLFKTAGQALFDCIVSNLADVRSDETLEIELSAETTLDLLVHWLNELVFCCETSHRLFSRFRVTLAPSRTALRATVGGERIDRSRHVLDHEVKAVTRHGAMLRQEADEWVAEVIVDI